MNIPLSDPAIALSASGGDFVSATKDVARSDGQIVGVIHICADYSGTTTPVIDIQGIVDASIATGWVTLNEDPIEITSEAQAVSVVLFPKMRLKYNDNTPCTSTLICPA
jgi:hypothetical protein